MEVPASMAAYIAGLLGYCLPSVCLWWAVTFLVCRGMFRLQYKWFPFLLGFIAVWIVDAAVIHLLRQNFPALVSPLVSSFIVPVVLSLSVLVAYAKATKAGKASGGEAV
ncbi:MULTISPECIES: hypothetical protein [Rhodanobacter]|uniref:hypothetical protein n=1 Tax=Rhodanobacter TaxID=75309 RepID=UPI0012DFDEB2|nr:MULTISPECIES: hypothetical protein [Rhodanobacter]UJJ52002.1 hypothetical protein LRK52_04730 [Rhodanobacter denitrificans]UJJ59215.1 hypothetical protein LRK55_03515 [Rhodanobacter denitrificans]UJM94746.1 hypothetical protein LRK32_04725 [Rhodanobacter denitrificans]UJM98276.1 hypothetical protein LRK44_04730 [Rhodanobacter denitrificans]UJN22311.1 hypothetical protein LRK54_03765 [Rhodanobacter denitrificans]